MESAIKNVSNSENKKKKNQTAVLNNTDKSDSGKPKATDKESKKNNGKKN